MCHKNVAHLGSYAQYFLLPFLKLRAFVCFYKTVDIWSYDESSDRLFYWLCLEAECPPYIKEFMSVFWPMYHGVRKNMP